MTERPARRGYNEHATRVGSADEAAPPAKGPHDCAANGCPMWASIALEGPRVCFVHAAIADRYEWDEATRRIRRQPALVEVIRALRRSSAPEIVEACLELCPQIASGDGTPTGHFDALRRAEALLIDECTRAEASSTFLANSTPDHGPVEAPLTRDEKRNRAIANIRHIASRPGPMSAQLPALLRTFERVYGMRCPVDAPRRAVPARVAVIREPGEDDE